jgi:hypothetical protein
VDSALATRPYIATLQTGHDAYGTILSPKTMGDVMLTMQPAGDYSPSYRTIFDYGRKSGRARSIPLQVSGGDLMGSTFIIGSSLMGTGESSQDVKISAFGSGRTISHEITHNGDNEPWRVGLIDVEVLVSQGQEDSGDASG